MISSSFAHTWSVLLAHLLAPAVRSLLLACFAALVLGLLRVRGVATRLAVWTAVLYAALAMPLLGLALPSVSLHIPASAAHFISQRIDPAIAPATAVKSAEVQAINPGPVVVTLDLSATGENSRDLPARPRGRAALYAAPAAATGGSLADSATTPPSPTALMSLPAVASTRLPFSWTSIFSMVYVSVCALFLARLFLGIFFGRRLVHFARPIGDAEVIHWLALRAREADLTVAPRLAESESITVPVTLGILRPVILFPADWRIWDAAALHAVIAHELSHVIRRDSLTQRLSLLHRAVFWFSPLSWWLHRRLADVAEEASDEAALVSGADRASYAETLLGFFAALQDSPRRVYWQGVSMAKAGQAERRVDRILAWKGNVGIQMNKFVGIAMIFAGVPAVLFAAAARPSVANVPTAGISVAGSPLASTANEPAQNGYRSANPAPIPSPGPVTPADPASAAPPAPPAVAGPVAPPALPSAAPEPMPAAAPRPAPQSGPAPAIPPIPPAPAAAPNVVVLPNLQLKLKNLMDDEQIKRIEKQLNVVVSNVDQSKILAQAQKAVELQFKQFEQDGKIGTVKLRVGDGGFSDRYVIVSGDSPIFMSGDSQDVEHATSLRGKISGDFIWFQRDEKSYVIRDQATVNRAKELFKPQQDLGEKQQALGKQQQALGDQERDLGKKMQSVQVQLPDMTADMAKLEADMKQLSAGGTEQQLGDLQREIGQLQRKVGQVQAQAGDQMRQAGEPMRALGEQQRQLGEQQRALGEQQREAARQARDQMKQLLDDAIAHGAAQPE